MDEAIIKRVDTLVKAILKGLKSKATSNSVLALDEGTIILFLFWYRMGMKDTVVEPSLVIVASNQDMEKMTYLFL